MQPRKIIHRPSDRKVTTSAPAVGIVALGLALALATPMAARADWQPGATRGETFTRVLVVGASPDPKQRCPFERFLVSRLQNDRTTAIASCDAAVQLEPLTRESIVEAVRIAEADAVVSTMLVSREWVEQHGGGRDTRGSASYKATDLGYGYGYYGVYGVPVVYADFQSAPPVTTMQGKAEVTTNVYRVKDASLVYNTNTKVKRYESRDQALSMIAKGISDQLRKAGVVR